MCSAPNKGAAAASAQTGAGTSHASEASLAAQPRGSGLFPGESVPFPAPQPPSSPPNSSARPQPRAECIVSGALYKHWLVSRAAPRHPRLLPGRLLSHRQSSPTKTSFSHRATRLHCQDRCVSSGEGRKEEGGSGETGAERLSAPRTGEPGARLREVPPGASAPAGA